MGLVTNMTYENAQQRIKDLKEELYFWRLLDDKIVPYTYEMSLEKIIDNFESISYSELIREYKKKYNPKYDNPTSLSIDKYNNGNWREERVELCTAFLKNSKEFYYSAEQASADTRPILYYYSLINLFAFLTNSFINFNNLKKHHGIIINNKDVNNIYFSYSKGGFFERLVFVLSTLEYPSSFSSFIVDYKDSNFDFLDYNTVFSISNKSTIFLKELVEYDYFNDLQSIKLCSKLINLEARYRETTSILRDFILIFISNNLARYYPVLWREVYIGKKGDLIYHIRNAYGNINKMVILVNKIFNEFEEKDFPRRIDTGECL